MMQTYYVDKTNQTFADTLTAFGLARVVNDLMFRQGRSDRHIQIQDCGAFFLLTAEPGVDTQQLDFLLEVPYCPVKVIPTNQYNEEKRPVHIPLVDWDAVSEFLQAAKAGIPKDSLPPRPDRMDILLTINPEAIQGYNGLLFDWWNVRNEQPEIIRIILEMFQGEAPESRLMNAVDCWTEIARKHNWKIDPWTTGQQLYNPDQGMGQNHPKANRVNTGSKPDRYANFWLVEWLRTIGFFEVAVPRLVGKKNERADEKDRKILVVTPHNLTYATIGNIMPKFEEQLTPETLAPLRFDIFAVIRFLKVLLAYLAEPDERDELETIGKIKTRLISGFYVSYYKKMGKARSLMNLSFVGVPGWIEIHSEADVRYFTKLLDELDKHLRQLDEEHSDTSDMIQHFRNFLSGDDLTAFLRFSLGYVSYFMRERERNPFIRPLSTALVERIIVAMGKKYENIGKKDLYPGFHNIARAISESTIIAQWRKVKQQNQTYEIRYGLHQDLARHAHTPEKFLAALGEFVHTYNAETSRAQELGRKPWRPMVESTDIGDLLRMMDVYGNSRMVAQLLIAFGSTFISDASTEENEESN